MILGIVLLVIGAGWLVEGAARLAYKLKLPKIIVGATVVSLGTTSPETAVSVLAAIKGFSGLSLGNAIGSVICDTGLIFGLGVLIGKVPADRFILNRQGYIQFGSAIFLAAVIYISYFVFGREPIIARPVGIVLLLMLASYLAISIKWARSHPQLAKILESEADTGQKSYPIIFCLFLISAGLSIVIKSSELVIEEGKHICLSLGVPESLIAVSGIALGTSLPELATALTSIKRGHPEILVGNVIGADILNILFVIGASATATALPVPQEVMWLYVPSMLAILITFRISTAVSKEYFPRASGFVLLILYAIFLLLVFKTGLYH